jgi:hypothetical protein
MTELRFHIEIFIAQVPDVQYPKTSPEVRLIGEDVDNIDIVIDG